MDQIRDICAGYIMKVGVETQTDDETNAIPRHATFYKDVETTLLKFSSQPHENFPPLNQLSNAVVKLLKKFD